LLRQVRLWLRPPPRIRALPEISRPQPNTPELAALVAYVAVSAETRAGPRIAPDAGQRE
jgi:hypothetical protein